MPAKARPSQVKPPFTPFPAAGGNKAFCVTEHDAHSVHRKSVGRKALIFLQQHALWFNPTYLFFGATEILLYTNLVTPARIYMHTTSPTPNVNYTGVHY